MKRGEDAPEYHSSFPAGKIAVTSTKACLTQRDLNLAYTPGVTAPCLEIHRDPDLAYKYTAKANLVAVEPRRVAQSSHCARCRRPTRFFGAMHGINRVADADEGTVRLSLDTKALVRIGLLSRGGKSRQAQKALDHDLEPIAKLTPLLSIARHGGNVAEVHHRKRHGGLHGGPPASDLADTQKNGCAPHTLVINAGNGPENNTGRIQWTKRLVELRGEHQVTVKLACYPPYHSKYNPVECVLGVQENYWNGDPLETANHAF